MARIIRKVHADVVVSVHHWSVRRHHGLSAEQSVLQVVQPTCLCTSKVSVPLRLLVVSDFLIVPHRGSPHLASSFYVFFLCPFLCTFLAFARIHGKRSAMAHGHSCRVFIGRFVATRSLQENRQNGSKERSNVFQNLRRRNGKNCQCFFNTFELSLTSQ